MLRSTTFTIFLLVCFSKINAQTDYLIASESSLRFISLKTLDLKNEANITEKVIIDNDTLVKLKPKATAADMDLFCQCFNKDAIVKIYLSTAFNKKNNEGLATSNQWSSKIIVYLDPKFSKQIKRAFKAFFKPIENIRNLSISYTNNKNDANYHILISDNTIKQFKNNDGQYSDFYPLSRVTYSLVNDKRNRFYTGKLKIDTKSLLDNETLILKKLKQLFYNSITYFQLNNIISKNSLTSINYDESNTISDLDVELLTLHYYRLHENPITFKQFYNLVKKAKSVCKK